MGDDAVDDAADGVEVLPRVEMSNSAEVRLFIASKGNGPLLLNTFPLADGLKGLRNGADCMCAAWL